MNGYTNYFNQADVYNQYPPSSGQENISVSQPTIFNQPAGMLSASSLPNNIHQTVFHPQPSVCLPPMNHHPGYFPHHTNNQRAPTLLHHQPPFFPSVAPTSNKPTSLNLNCGSPGNNSRTNSVNEHSPTPSHSNHMLGQTPINQQCLLTPVCPQSPELDTMTRFPLVPETTSVNPTPMAVDSSPIGINYSANPSSSNLVSSSVRCKLHIFFHIILYYIITYYIILYYITLYYIILYYIIQ